VNAKGGFAASEAYAWHRALLAEKGAGYDPRIRVRIERGERMTATEYLELVAARRRLIAGFDVSTREFDALIMPTVPIVPPRIADLDDEREYNRINLHILRNTALTASICTSCAIPHSATSSIAARSAYHATARTSRRWG
jgi:aspartyl-tRNA(Asn)/glutamyl-tRNA(Gln) amidotransferase subunit A